MDGLSLSVVAVVWSEYRKFLETHCSFSATHLTVNGVHYTFCQTKAGNDTFLLSSKPKPTNG